MAAFSMSSTLGFPRIGVNRAMKKNLEAFWSGAISADALRAASAAVAAESLKVQADAGIDLIAVGDHTMYDHVLDWTMRFGCAPARFAALSGLDQYFAMARGIDDAPALDMSKFFGTNYHYLVPELSKDTVPKACFSDFMHLIKSAQASVGTDKIAPVVVGPITYVRIARLADDTTREEMVDKLVPVYAELLTELKALGVPEVQMHEPALVQGDAPSLKGMYEKAYAELAKVQVPMHIVTYFDDLDEEVMKWVVVPGVKALSLDFTRGNNINTLQKVPLPATIRLGAGVVDARSVWSDNLSAPYLLDEVKRVVSDSVLISVQPSASLMFVPLDLDDEPNLPEEVRPALAFAKQKLDAVVSLKNGATLDVAHARKDARMPGVQEAIKATIDEALFARPETFEERRPQQFSVPGGFGTTTIGSFPQTKEIRRLRLQLKKGNITAAEYNAEVDKHLAFVVGVQEALGLDVFVHGEPERTDMVEYFGVKLNGFIFTANGWVQSYGSRYVRPPIIHGDVSRAAPMTVREFAVAQSMTGKPVKGMLTGATTIINWSFPRKDIPREQQAYQIALALREEVLDLERAGCRIIQVDDPALREGLPLKEKQWASYLEWAVRAFRLTTSGVKPATQIVTHLCYADFEDILQAIDAMDADVLTIENSRSGDDMLRALAKYGYARDIGPGVYDIHSPVVPKQAAIEERVKLFIEAGLNPDRLWVNPDCGLKTRNWKEVLPSLHSMVAAARAARSGNLK